MNWITVTLTHAFVMLWQTFWALVLGFGISAALQVFVSKERMSRAFGQTNVKTMALATGLGAASSSCSYAAAAAARSAVKQGAALIPALAFMFASTNLVIELGAVLWILMGWTFVLAEVLGGFVLIGMIWLLATLFLPRQIQEAAQQHAATADNGDAHACHDEQTSSCHDGHEMRGRKTKSQRLASVFLMDWQMQWKEILGGFLIAGLLMGVVPPNWWRALFLETGSPVLRLVENALVGPIIAIASFVCSVGNIPLASLLWSDGISFGGVISFIYADLLVLPLIVIYVKYYGGRATAYLVAIFYAAMVISGIVVDCVFAALGLIPSRPAPESMQEYATIGWNYTSWLDLAALVVFLTLLCIHLTSGKISAENGGT